MTDTTPDNEFWELADAFVDLANRNCDETPRGKVSAAMLYAAARFNAFVVASSAKSREELSAQNEEAVAYFLLQYEKVLRENLGDYEANFAKYIQLEV